MEISFMNKNRSIIYIELQMKTLKLNVLYKEDNIMIIGRGKFLSIPIESYSNQLLYYLNYYLYMIEININIFSPQEYENSKIYLRWIVFSNDKKFIRDFNRIENKIKNETIYWYIFNNIFRI